ncbi:uncharacterized protein LOC129409806 [Boleophthalmus pectinirostris]|uniref:uncharacterized protein LOC129409806 n=1 Tax=Boleophthalmus pectinirostris TaxID=150288 RepID=UPI00242B0D1F|nr:uncharacterized protein LOC129409806 [Boleophthalmus pectinirostris]
MVDNCCAPGCTNKRGKKKGTSFYRIPKDAERRAKWISAIKRARSQQKKTERWDPPAVGFRLCSDHFISGRKSDNPWSPDFIPSIFNYVPSPEKRKIKMRLEVFNRRQKAKLQKMEQTKLSAEAISPRASTDCPQESSKDPTVHQTPITEPLNESTHEEPGNDVQPVHHDDPTTPPCSTETCRKYVQSLEQECQALRTENMLLKEKNNRITMNEMTLHNNDKRVNILTGLLTYSILMTIFQIVAPFLKLKSDVTCFQQYILTLMKLRMNLSFDFLAFYFGVDSTTVSKLFKHCISVMHCRLVPSLVLWPDRESLRKSLPYAFRNSSFEKTVCIIDCFEIFLEKPSRLLASAQCYSSYKSHHTLKYLIAVCPQGSICFISTGWGGRTSDKLITEQSNFLSHVLPGDIVLADRGFLVKESIQRCQAELKIPAFTRGKKQLDPIELENTRCLASLRIHIERVIGVLRQKYTILQNTVPLSFTDIERENDVTYLDKIVSVCCALTNVCESVVPFE